MQEAQNVIPQNPQGEQQGYFPGDNFDYSKQSFGAKLKKYWDGFMYYLRQVWPYVYKLINFLVYEILKVLKAIVKIALQQVGIGRE